MDCEGWKCLAYTDQVLVLGVPARGDAAERLRCARDGGARVLVEVHQAREALPGAELGRVSAHKNDR
jgi:hypothetical protein